MIVSASYRTDIPAFYGRWFLNRLNAGYCTVVNPYGGRRYRVDLTPAAVDGFVFWTRNLEPFQPALAEVSARGLPFMVQFSLTGYPRVLEPSVIEPARALAQLQQLAQRHGPRAGVWRYDPIVLSNLTPTAWHEDTFTRLAGQLAGVVDEVVISFVQPYAKTTRKLAAAATADGFCWDLPEQPRQRQLAQRLAAIAAAHGLGLSACTQPALSGVPGVRPARCVDAARLSDLAGRPIAARLKGNRPGCGCHQSRDIGDYDSCPHGCAYCYAVAAQDRARQRWQQHDPAGESLINDRPLPHT